jgi:hypothetical protein
VAWRRTAGILGAASTSGTAAAPWIADVVATMKDMIGRLEKTVIDCPDSRALAAFYAEVLGMRVNEDREDWVVIGLGPGDPSPRLPARHDMGTPALARP